MDAPVAEGQRVGWQDVPAPVRDAIQNVCGTPVREATTQPGGFSPGLAARLGCEDGRRFFVKAVSSAANPHSPAMHRREAQILRALDPLIRSGDLPAPRLVDTVEQDTWIALVLTDVEGRQPLLPWTTEQLTVALNALDRVAHVLTPSPIVADTIADKLSGEFAGWRTLAETSTLEGLDPWSRDHLDRLAILETDWQRCAAGNTLLHTDLRADNLLLTDHGAVLVDWPGACTGAAFVDLVMLAPSVTMQGGPYPTDLLAASETGRGVTTEQLRPVVCAVAGYFTERSLQPAPPGLPTVRAFQAAQAAIARRWLADIF
jgi:aminoglycoside phosphotransferase (APT) family kinase protein